MRVRRQKKRAPAYHPIADTDPALATLIAHGAGYRGMQCIQWASTDGGTAVCAVQCRCGQWWGWYPERVAVTVREAMLVDGCRSCV